MNRVSEYRDLSVRLAELDRIAACKAIQPLEVIKKLNERPALQVWWVNGWWMNRVSEYRDLSVRLAELDRIAACTKSIQSLEVIKKLNERPALQVWWVYLSGECDVNESNGWMQGVNARCEYGVY